MDVCGMTSGIATKDELMLTSWIRVGFGIIVGAAFATASLSRSCFFLAAFLSKKPHLPGLYISVMEAQNEYLIC